MIQQMYWSDVDIENSMGYCLCTVYVVNKKKAKIKDNKLSFASTFLL